MESAPQLGLIQRGRLWSSMLTSVVPLQLLVLGGCFAGGFAAGGFTLVDNQAMTKVQQVNDPELTADAKRLEGKSFGAGTPEYYAGLCLQGYINGRYAELTMSNTSDASEQSALQSELIGGYGGCAQNCMAASEQLKSSYSDIAAKYQPRCAQGMASQNSKFTTDALAKAVESFKEASQPLELYFAERDSRQLLQTATSESPEEPRLAQFTDDIETMSKQHAAAIAKGKAFYEGPEAQANFSQREAIDAERAVLLADLKDIESRQDDLRRNGSLDAHMRSRELDDQSAAKRRLLAVKDNELARLKEQYIQMASAKGVYKSSGGGSILP